MTEDRAKKLFMEFAAKKDKAQTYFEKGDAMLAFGKYTYYIDHIDLNEALDYEMLAKINEYVLKKHNLNLDAIMTVGILDKRQREGVELNEDQVLYFEDAKKYVDETWLRLILHLDQPTFSK
ncbi:MAG: hypothetical protein ACRC5Q_03105 [Culicoidibacterales bacterium]